MSSDPDHAEILRRGPTAWNAWREKNPSTIPDLAGIALNLSERQMGPINGGPINLRSARMQDAMLRFATLSSADLEAADMSGSDLAHARCERANLRSADLSSARLDHADFSAADLACANLRDASLSFATLSGTGLEAADLSGADLAHARLDRANLRTANFTNALLDHADFAGADLAKANLCGANLYHAKNLTETQLEEAMGSDSTILPPQLRGTVSWSVERSQTETTLERVRPQLRRRPDVDVPQKSSYNRPAWIAGFFLIGGVLVTTGLVWQHMNGAVPFDTQTGSEQSVGQSKLSPDTGEQQSAPDATMEKKAAAVPGMPSAANKVDRTESAPEQGPTPEPGSPTIPQENVHVELQPSDGANRLGEASGPNEHALGSLEVPEPKSNEGSEPSPIVSLESPVTTSRHGTVPDVPSEAAIPDPQLTPTTEAPAALALSTPEQSPASPLSDTIPALPTIETVLPHEAESPPMPVRKPVIQKGEVNSNPDRAESKKPVRKTQNDTTGKPDKSRRAKAQSFVEKKAEQMLGSGSIVDLLAGGL